MDRHLPLHSSFHGSMRSRDSTSTVESDPREKIKDCFRKFIAFMFTQVGVGALVVCYAILGAAGFMHIEKDNPDQQIQDVKLWRQNCAEKLWNITVDVNIFNKTVWVHNVNSVLKVFQNNITAAVHTGYSGRSADDIWSFPAALMYSLSVFTMIGYGNIVPKTVWGKLVSIAYACFGIPIYVLYFCNMGKVLAQTFKWLYITAHECSRRDDTLFEDGEIQPKRKITVPSTACLWVISFYILTGTIMFGAWEKWNYLDSTYFCVISLCKIGFGDFVPGANISDSAGGSHLKLVINFIYVLLGMGLVAMCYNLMCEDVRVKVRELREDLKNCLDDITLKITVCMNDTKYYHQKQTRNMNDASASIGFRGAMLPLRLRRVAGHEGRLNDTLFQPAAARPATPQLPQTLIYFGGDVQDYPEVMQAHRDNRNYLRWNLENTARMLGHNFPDRHILVVRPSRIEYKSFSCYDNFVPSNNAGVPDHTPTHSALHHLERLLQGVSTRLKAMPTSELLEAVTSVSLPEDIDIEDLHNASIHGIGQSKTNGSTKTDATPAAYNAETSAASGHKPDTDPLWWREKLALDESRLSLVGFSKGCVVLNQIIYEFHYTKTLTPGDAHMMRFMERIEEMWWLDGGHAGGKNTWITSRSLLETLTRLNVNIFIHVSPYQVQDEGRPWIGREEKAFTSLLKKLGARVSRYLHDQPGVPHSLQMHFEVLAKFKRAQDSAPADSDEDI